MSHKRLMVMLVAALALGLLFAGSVEAKKGGGGGGGGGGKPSSSADPAIASIASGGLHVVNEDGSNETTIYGEADWHPSWSPDGVAIAFVGPLPYPKPILRAYVRVVGGVPQAQEVVQIDDGSCRYCSHPSWSPLGDWIAVSGRDDAEELESVRLIPAPDGGAYTVIYTADVDYRLDDLAWRADGGAIAVLVSSPLGREIRVLTLGADGVSVTQVSTVLDPFLDLDGDGHNDEFGSVDWARRSDKLAFNVNYWPSAPHRPKRKIYVMDLTLDEVTGSWSGSTPTYLTKGEGPSWSPYDTKLVKYAGIYDFATGDSGKIKAWRWADWRGCVRADPDGPCLVPPLP